MKYNNGVRLEWDSKGQQLITNKHNNIKDKALIYPYTSKNPEVLFRDTLYYSDNSIVGHLIQNDALSVINNLIEAGYEECFDLLYFDPPYYSNSKYTSTIKLDGSKVTRNVFNDDWKSLNDYLDFIFPILKASKNLLSKQGTIFLHLDFHASHYVKILLDEIFSPDNFINEIIWCYGGGSGSKKHFHRKHDNILWYAKTDKYIFNPQYRPYTHKTLERGLTKVKGSKYKLNEKGALMHDWWADINKILSPTAFENLKFPTQKPFALIERLIKTASNEGSLIGDFFVGSGTTAQVADNLNRKWIVSDISDIAIQTTHNRLINCLAKPYKVEFRNSTCLPLNCEWYYHKDILTIKLNNIDRFYLWELGFVEQDVFNSFVQVNRRKINSDLNDKLIVKGLDCKRLALRAYDYTGNIYTYNIDIK